MLVPGPFLYCAAFSVYFAIAQRLRQQSLHHGSPSQQGHPKELLISTVPVAETRKRRANIKK